MFAFVCLKYIYCTIVSALVERNVKGHCSGPTPLSYDNKLRCYNEMVSRMSVQRKLKEKMTYTHTSGKKTLFIITYICMHLQTEGEKARDRGDRKTDRRREMF